MIRRLFSLAIFFGVILAVTGYFRGWYVVSPPHDQNGDHVDFHITVDKDKFKEDAKRFEDFTRNATTQAKQEVEKAASAMQQQNTK